VADASEVLAALLAVVSAKTGYDVAELDPSYELEADLGIDTVKQAEIFGEVRARYGLGRDDSFRLADYPTLSGLAGWLAAQVAACAAGTTGAAAPVEASPITNGTSVVAAAGSLDVSVAADGSADASAADVSAAAADVSPAAADVSVEVSADVSEDVSATPAPEADPALALPASFRVRRPILVERPANGNPSVKGRSIRVLGGGALADALAGAILEGGGTIDGVPDVVIDVGMPILDVFAQAKALGERPPAQWVAVTRIGPDLRAARDGGARAGLAKALGREWPGCRARVIDLEAGVSPELAADAILAELSETDRAAEVVLGNGTRQAVALATEALPVRGGRLPMAAPVVLLTGGTRGITSRVAVAFAKAGPCTLVLVGRTAPGPAPLDEDVERAGIKARIEADGARATPKRVEDALRPLRVAEEARRTVAELTALGARVDVRALDIADEVEVHHLVETVLAAYGRIDVVVHGAGVEESRMLADKTAVAFQRVYAGKADGGLALASLLPAETVFVSMGSIAGRFGNPGQVDYAAANEAMARVCRARPRSLHVCWTAWADVGMAVRGGMETLLTGRGVELLPAEPGARLLVDMVAAGVTGEVVVAGRLGDFSLPSLHPLLDVIEPDGDAVIGRRTLSLETDPWIVDHSIDGVPVLPGVIGLEMMVAAALAAVPRGRYVGLEDVRFDAPLKLHRDEPALIAVRAEPTEDGTVRCRLSSTRRTRTGRDIQTDHFEAVVHVDEMPLLPALKSAFFPEERLSRRDIYRRFFHGSRFQVLGSAEAVAVQGLLAEGRVEHASIAEGLLIDPLVIEAAFQAAGLHRMALAGIMALPASIDAVERVRPVIEGDTLQIMVQARDGAYDIDVDGAEGRVLRVRGFRMVDRGPLPPGDRFPEPDGGWPSASLATASEARVALSGGDVAWSTSRGTPKRQADRLAGQLAARRAVEALVGHPRFAVVRAPSGEPRVEGADVAVTISHVDGEAVAMAVRGARAGIDLEVIAERHPAFADEWFTAAEQARLPDAAALTAAWAVKEAVLKALGAGLALSPREVEVLAVDGGAARVRLSGEVAQRHAALGGAPLRVRIAAFAGRVVATAVFAA
jgi:NAD(P)-dependent dehydrogenase (short-subunit alcohol dehydrogenase family)/4'-phosphopantetheinyl transferase EntD